MSRTATSRKPQKCSSKIVRWNRVHVLLQADQRPMQNHKDEILPAHPQELFLLARELGLMLNQENIRSPIIQCRRNWSIFFVMVVYFEKMMERLNSGESKTIFRNILCFVIIGLEKSGRAEWPEGGGNKKRFQSSGEFLYFRALQGHSGRNPIDPSLQDNVLIPDNFFKYIRLVGCAINLHFIINSGLIPVRTEFERKTDSIGQRTQGSWHDRLGSIASCTIHT